MTQAFTRRDALAMAGALALPRLSRAPAAVSPPAAAAAVPDLANLHGLMTWLGTGHAPRLSFLDTRWRDVEDWKREARPVYASHLLYEPEARPLGADLLGREERDGFTVETVRIHATDAYDIPARVLVPAGRKGRGPALVALHCHSGRYVWGHEKVVSSPGDGEPLRTFRDGAYGRPYAELLARRGFVVVVIDAFYFGARRLRPEDLAPATAPVERELVQKLATLESGTAEWHAAVNRLCGRYEELTAKTLFTTGVTWPGLLVWDDKRSVDYLCGRPDVDPGRIGCLGLSIGGLRAARLAGADARIKASCVVGWMIEFAQLVPNHLRHHTWMAYVPGLQTFLDLPDVAALTMPGALLVQQCAKDALYPLSAMKDAAAKLERIYAKAGLAERYRATFYDEPHSFRPAMQDEAIAWLEKWV
jgi:dienelactone hydrolase